MRGGNIKGLGRKFFWILLAGVIFFFGILTYLIIQRESDLIRDIYIENSLNESHLISEHLKDLMFENKANEIVKYIEDINISTQMKVGIFDRNGNPAFGTLIHSPLNKIPDQKTLFTKTEDYLIAYKPLQNEARCHACHDPSDDARGMVIIKHSMNKIEREINETVRHILIFTFFLGLSSEIFLVLILKKLILNPIEALNKGSQMLKTGKLDHRIENKADDEIGALASCFNEMAESLEKSHVNLENAVRQRTKELRVIAELSTEVFQGNLTFSNMAERFLDSITGEMGFGYASLCLVKRETGMLSQEYKKGVNYEFCKKEVALASEDPFAEITKEARPVIKKFMDKSLPAENVNIAIIPLISFQRKRCRDMTRCYESECPAFENTDDRCWLIHNTLCRSPRTPSGKDKIYGCLKCSVFPVLGVLIAGRQEEIPKSSLHSLEILASQMSSAIENLEFIRGKKEDIKNLIKLHDISVESLQDLNIHELTKSVVLHAAAFAKTDASILWLVGKDNKLHFESSHNIEKEFIPQSLNIDELITENSLIEDRLVESIPFNDLDFFRSIFEKYGFLYIAVVPLRTESKIHGCLTLFNKKDFFMQEPEKAMISLFANQATSAIHTASLYGELLEQKEFSETIFNNISSGIIVLDKEGRILKINRTGQEILKINLSDTYGKRFADVCPGAGLMLSAGQNLNSEIVIFSPDDGKSIPVGFTNSRLLDPALNENGIIILFRDLTEIKKLQEELTKKQHFEAMGKVVAGVAHEIRNPLFGISSIVQILEREVRSEKHNTLLQAMLREIYRLKNLIDELLLYSRPSKLNITEIDFGILAENLENYIRAKKDDIAVNLEFRSRVSIKGDMDKLTQVFLNLVDNSIGAGSKQIDIRAEKKGATAVITVKDNGSGIKKEALEKVFDLFFTTKKEGTGLGLSICRKIIEDHRGDIVIHSAEGKGTTVIITFKES